MIGAQWHGADLASMIVIDTAKAATVREADLIIIGTAMSVEFDSTHQGCCCCEPFNLEQHCSYASPHAVLYRFLLATLKVSEGKHGYCHCLLVQLMPCNAPRVLCSREL